MMMGGTLPVLSKFFVTRMNTLGWNVGRLYSVNNFGALVGCFLAGFVLIRTFGMTRTLLSAAALNLIAAAAAFLIARRPRPLQAEATSGTVPSEMPMLPDHVVRFVMWAFAVEGFTALAYEVLWARILLGFSYDKSLYFYTTVIFTFIFGLSLGSLLMAKAADKRKNLLMLFALVEITIGALAILLLRGFAVVADILAEWRPSYSENWWDTLGKEYLLFFLVMLLPATLMGMTFPLVSRICTPSLKRLGSRLGEIGFLDTVGSIFGSFAAGFLMIPFLGVVKSVIIAGVVNTAIGLTAAALDPASDKRVKTAWFGSTAVLFLILMLLLPDAAYFRHWQTRRPGDRLLFYKEGPDAAVAVPQHSDGVKFLSINGSVTAFAEFGDLRVHKMLGCLPALLHENPRSALVIGLGMGVTARSLADQGVERVDCVEINAGVVQACAEQFADVNGGVLNDPRVRVIVDDGRSYLFMTDKKYDLITSNAVHARLSGNLYTREFYEICRRRLTENGVMCQWTSTNWLTPSEFKSLLVAFNAVFPHTSLWLVNAGHLLIVGTPQPLVIPYDDWRQRLAQPEAKQDLQPFSLGSAELISAHFISDEKAFPVMLKNMPMTTDDRPMAELSRVVSKMQIPEVVLELIHFKRDAADRLTFSESTHQEMEYARAAVKRYAEAEKYYLEGTFANNFYNDPYLALNMVTEALRLEPDDYRYHEEAASLNLNLAQNLTAGNDERKKLLENAVSHLQAMIAVSPNFAYDWNNLGFVLMNCGRLAEAEEAFRRALELAPEYPMPRNYLAALVGGRGQLKEAEQLLLQAVRDFPDEVESYYRLGLVYELMKRPGEAQKAFAQVVRRDPTYRDANLRLQALGGAASR